MAPGRPVFFAAIQPPRTREFVSLRWLKMIMGAPLLDVIHFVHSTSKPHNSCQVGDNIPVFDDKSRLREIK